MTLNKGIAATVAIFSLIAFLSPLPTVLPDAKERFAFDGVAFAEQGEPFASSEDEPFETQVQIAPDPLERMNRAFFKFNDKFYFWFLKPVCIVYSAFVPTGVRRCIRNAYDNVLMPVRAVNCTLQGKFPAAGEEVGRFFINSTLGLGGLFDVANTHFNLNAHDEDLGQTLGFYGMKPFAYVYLPLFGPSSIRDGIGLVGDTFLNPVYYLSPGIEVSVGYKGGVTMNNASLRIGEYEDFKKAALDPYISMRDAYLQNRVKAIKE